MELTFLVGLPSPKIFVLSNIDSVNNDNEMNYFTCLMDSKSFKENQENEVKLPRVDPLYFQVIYDYLRGYHVDLSSKSLSDIENIRRDADYFALRGFVGEIDQHVMLMELLPSGFTTQPLEKVVCSGEEEAFDLHMIRNESINDFQGTTTYKMFTCDSLQVLFYERGYHATVFTFNGIMNTCSLNFTPIYPKCIKALALHLNIATDVSAWEVDIEYEVLSLVNEGQIVRYTTDEITALYGYTGVKSYISKEAALGAIARRKGITLSSYVWDCKQIVYSIAVNVDTEGTPRLNIIYHLLFLA